MTFCKCAYLFMGVVNIIIMYLFIYARTNLTSFSSMFEYFEHFDDSDNSTQMYVFLKSILFNVVSQVNLSLIRS